MRSQRVRVAHWRNTAFSSIFPPPCGVHTGSRWSHCRGQTLSLIGDPIRDYLFPDKPFISVTFIFKEIGFLLDVWGGICQDSVSPKIMMRMTMAAALYQVLCLYPSNPPWTPAWQILSLPCSYTLFIPHYILGQFIEGFMRIHITYPRSKREGGESVF